MQILNRTVQDQKVGAYKIGLGHVQEKMPQFVETYQHFTGECFKEGELTNKHKQLIALGVSLFANNEICTFYHVDEAIKHGASAGEIMETVAVTAAIGGGHAMSQGVTRVQKVLDQYSN